MVVFARQPVFLLSFDGECRVALQNTRWLTPIVIGAEAPTIVRVEAPSHSTRFSQHQFNVYQNYFNVFSYFTNLMWVCLFEY